MDAAVLLFFLFFCFSALCHAVESVNAPAFQHLHKKVPMSQRAFPVLQHFHKMLSMSACLFSGVPAFP